MKAGTRFFFMRGIFVHGFLLSEVAFIHGRLYKDVHALSHLITCQDPGHPSVFVKNKGKKMGEILCQICYDRQWANKKKAQHSFELEKQI